MQKRRSVFCTRISEALRHILPTGGTEWDSVHVQCGNVESFLQIPIRTNQIDNPLNLSLTVYGSFTLEEIDLETGTNSMKFCCQWVSISENIFIQIVQAITPRSWCRIRSRSV